MINQDQISMYYWQKLSKDRKDNQFILKDGLKQFLYIKKYIKKESNKDRKDKKFLEIGCSVSPVGLIVSKIKGWKAYGVDYNAHDLNIAKKIWQKMGIKPRFTEANISNLPYKNNSFDLIFGSGVLEHVYDTQKAVNELFRVLKSNSVCINTVPAFSLSSLTYRQLSGTIPEVIILKQLFEFIHIKVLKRKFMPVGYEKCFTKNYLVTAFKKAGFSQVKVEHDTLFKADLSNFPKFIKKFLLKLENFKPFWAWYTITAKK